MPEQQNIEYKQSWHEDYLKWVCGFANVHEVKIVENNKSGAIGGVIDNLTERQKKY